ncbi:MAG TPA: glycosyltransferase family 4 protein [Bacillales bacterium]|nr:glycosyltransferase family 4 protein [Bacillales bacterium]
MKLNKVCHLSTVHAPKDTRIFSKECVTLHEAGYETHFVVAAQEDFIEKGVSVHALGRRNGSRLGRMTAGLLRLYREALNVDADLYHFHDPELLLVGLLLKRKGKRVVYDVHEDVPRQILTKSYIAPIFRKGIAFLMEKLEHYAAKRFDGIVTATPFINKRFLALNANSVNVNNYPILNELSLQRQRTSRKASAVCFVGVMNEIRGIFQMIRAAELADVKLLLGGTFSNEGDRAKAVRLSGWSHVVDLGFLDRPQVAEVLDQSAAGFVVYHAAPNHIHAQPNKLFEYMSSGLPVIASHFPLWREIVEGNDCGICVDPLDPEAMAKAIWFFLDHPDEAARMGENGRRAIEEKYNWRPEGDKLVALYERLLQE